MGDPDDSRYGFLNTNWENFSVEREVFGIWGYQDVVSGNMNSLGFVVKDTSCTGNFATNVGPEFTWTTLEPVAKALRDANIKA